MLRESAARVSVDRGKSANSSRDASLGLLTFGFGRGLSLRLRVHYEKVDQRVLFDFFGRLKVVLELLDGFFWPSMDAQTAGVDPGRINFRIMYNYIARKPHRASPSIELLVLQNL
jgi:hypothetical protein